MAKKIIKLIMSMLLVISLNQYIFAAIVSDNDGSAFVTKSEFESLKEQFAKQINDISNAQDITNLFPQYK